MLLASSILSVACDAADMLVVCDPETVLLSPVPPACSEVGVIRSCCTSGNQLCLLAVRINA
jgi:hypothetical protein